MAIHAFKAGRGAFICHNPDGETETVTCPSTDLDKPEDDHFTDFMFDGAKIPRHVVPVGETCHGWKIFHAPDDPPARRGALSWLGRFFGLSALLVTLALPAPALASSGAGALYGTPGGGFGATEYSGDASGVSEAYTDLGSHGYLQFGPGMDGVDPWTIPSGVCVVRTLFSGFDVAGVPLRWYTRAGVKTVQADSAGVSVTGRVRADSLRADGGLYVWAQKVTKIFAGSSTLDFNLSVLTCQELSISINGVEPNDPVFVGPGEFAPTPDVSIFGYVSASGVVKVKMCRFGGAVNPSADTFQVVVFKVN